MVTYDEHGGFYDHVPPPQEDVPNPDGINCEIPKFNFTRLGIRIPTLLISPWIEKGTLINEPTNTSTHYDHTSLSKSMRKMWGIEESLTKREEWAASFEQYFTLLESPRTDCPLTLPSPPPEASRSTDGKVNDLQRSLMKFASILNREFDLDDWNSIGTEFEAGLYCRAQFSKFLDEGKSYKNFIMYQNM